jgi:hypothetical protein
MFSKNINLVKIDLDLQGYVICSNVQMFFFKIYEPEKRDRHDPLHIRPPERI